MSDGHEWRPRGYGPGRPDKPLAGQPIDAYPAREARYNLFTLPWKFPIVSLTRPDTGDLVFSLIATLH